MKYSFPAILKADLAEPGFTIITFPDLLGIGSECEVGHELETAEEILKLALSIPDRRKVEPTDIEVLKKKFPDSKVILVTVNISF